MRLSSGGRTGDSAASLIFGGGDGHMPILNGDSRANRTRGPDGQPSAPAAGALNAVQTRERCTQELRGERKMKAPARALGELYDDYLNASEDYTFGKLHANLGKMERRAEREHGMYNGAAGWSTEHRNDIADARAVPGGRRARSPARFGQREFSRMAAPQEGSSVASLLQQGDYNHGLPQRRPESPGRTRPSVPPLPADSFRGDNDTNPPSARGFAASTSCSQRRASSPRRAQSPGRSRPQSQDSARGAPQFSARAQSPYRQRAQQ